MSGRYGQLIFEGFAALIVLALWIGYWAATPGDRHDGPRVESVRVYHGR
jgi:hypothetical protein